MQPDLETLASLAFWLRQGHSLELFFCGASLLVIYFKFNNRIVRRALRWSIAWFFLYAACRLLMPIIDFYGNRGYGLSSLVINLVFWMVPCVLLSIFLIKLKKGVISTPTVSAKADTLFDEIFREMRNNRKKTDNLEDLMVTHIKEKL